MMNKRIQAILVVLVVLFASLPAFALQPTGELKASIGYAWDGEEKKLEHNSTRTGFRLVLEDSLDFGGRLHFSTKGWWDFKQKDGNLSLDQLWLSGYKGDLDYQVGHQLISWGTADGFNPTNYFARMSMDSLLSGDMSGDPVWAGQATYYGSNWSVTGAVIPFFSPQKIDDQMKQMMGAEDPMVAQVLQAIEDTKKPKGLGKTSEIALRAETQIAGFDLQASFYSGFEPLPGLEMALVMQDIPGVGMMPVPSYQGIYRRQNFVGLATTGTIGSIGVWGELSYGGPTKFAEPEANPLEIARVPLSVNEKYLQAVIGGDYTFALGKGLLTQVQYIYRGQGSLLDVYVMPKIDFPIIEPGEIKGASYLYGRLGYDFNTSAAADLLVLHGFQEKGGIIRPSFTYGFPNSIKLELSVIKPYGDGDLASFGTAGQFAVSYQF